MMTNNSNINTGRIRIFEERASDREQQDSRWVYLERLPDNGWRVHEDNMGATAKRMFGRVIGKSSLHTQLNICLMNANLFS